MPSPFLQAEQYERTAAASTGLRMLFHAPFANQRLSSQVSIFHAIDFDPPKPGFETRQPLSNTTFSLFIASYTYICFFL